MRSLRLLRLLVTVLMGVMIVGFIILIALLVTRFPRGPQPPDLPDTIALPDGTTPAAFTQGSDWFAIVTTDDRILIYDRAGGTLRQTIAIDRAR